MTESNERLKANVTSPAPSRREIEAELSAEDVANEYTAFWESTPAGPKSRASGRGWRPGP